MEYTPDARPTSLEELQFEQRSAVRWFSPGVLARSGMKVVLSSAFGDYLDKRELQTAFPAGLTFDSSAEAELWFDFIADSGDGFDATYSVAWAASQRALTVRADATANRDAPTGAQLTLPRGQVVIFGGDEVYPVARVEDYQDRFVGPYKAALPWTDPPTASTASDAPGAHPRLLAIPGNHDWYDGLTGFMRVFGQQSWIGGRQSVQTRSYFAAALPARWWLWGIDIQSDAYLDSAQIRYFRDVGTKIAAGDRLILCTAKPSWAEGHEPDAYRNLAYVERNLVPDQCEAVLMISGDSHHYARYRSDTGREKITAGGGGAFLSATHALQKEVDVPTAPDGELSRHELQRCYPDARTSSRLAWRALALPFRNPSFMWVPGILHVLLFMTNQFGLRSVQNGSSDFETAAGNWSWLDLALGRLRNPLTLVVILTLFALLTGFAKPPASIRARWAKLATRLGMGGFHTILQLATAATVAYAATRILGFADGFAYVVLVVLFIAVVGAVCGAIALGLYLVLALTLLGTHQTEVFSAIREEGYKNFLRLHIAPDGSLTVYALGIDRVVKDWDLDPDNPDNEASYLKPHGDASIDVRLIDQTSFDRGSA